MSYRTSTSKLFTREWWVATRDRVVKSMAQALIFAIGANYAGWLDMWYQTLIMVLTMGLLSFATAIAFPPNEVTEPSSAHSPTKYP